MERRAQVVAPRPGGRLDVGEEDHLVNCIAWDAVADAQGRAETVPRPPRERFNWMQFRGLGPGEELFGPLDRRSVLELGCGGGDALAYLVTRGADRLGVDVSDRQVHRARTRWTHQHAGRLRF